MNLTLSLPIEMSFRKGQLWVYDEEALLADRQLERRMVKGNLGRLSTVGVCSDVSQEPYSLQGGVCLVACFPQRETVRGREGLRFGSFRGL